MFDKEYAEFYDQFNTDKPRHKEIPFVYGWAEKPMSIFDIGAGTGSYWFFYPDGVTILGIEKSRSMIRQSDISRGRIIHGDITDYKHRGMDFDCSTALFHVLNYIPRHDWWKNIPIKKGGYFIFDILSKEKAKKDGFKETWRKTYLAGRKITPLKFNGKTVNLLVELFNDNGKIFEETHKLYLWSHADIKRFCGKEFEIVEVKETKTWTVWYKLRRK